MRYSHRFYSYKGFKVISYSLDISYEMICCKLVVIIDVKVSLYVQFGIL